ncbi:hypothetical protein Tco_1420360 [Tanacetum coccineum]
MTTLAEHIIVAGAENSPPMLEKSMYDSWVSRIRLFIKGKKHGRMMLDSIDNGLLVYPTIEENGQTRPKKYSELTEVQQLQDDCDVQATNIILHGLPPEGETLYEYYWRFSQLINDMQTIRITMQQVQVNTKFLNALPSEWSKFVTNLKLAKCYSMYPPPQQFTPIYAAPIHHQHHHTPVYLVNPQQHLVSPPPFISPSMTPQSQAEFLQLDSASRFPPLNNQLRTSFNPRNQATIRDGRVTVQQCTQPKRPRNAAWFKVKLMLPEGQEAGQILDKEQIAFLADPSILEAPVAHQTIPQNSALQTDDLDAYDSDCDDLSSAKAILMANLSSCNPEVLSEIHSGSNIIPYSQYLQETQDAVIQDTNPSVPNDLLVLFLVEQMSDHVVFWRQERFEIQIKQLRIDNDQLLNQIMSQEIMHIVANSVDNLDVKKSCVNDCNKCLELEIELFKKKDFVEKKAYDKLVKSYSNLEKHCILLELATQLNQEIFQRENSGENLNAPTFNQLFQINELKAQSQEKDTVIRKLKERIKSLSRKDSVENVKKDIDEIEIINIELEHSMAKLLSENI